MIDLDDVFSTTFEVRNSSDVLTTPASHSCTLTLPDGTTATPTLTVPSTGVLRLDYQTVQEGRHAGYVDTTTPDTRQYFEFDVVVPTFIVSLLDARDHLNITSTTNDEELRRFIDAATDFVESRIGPVARQTIGPVIVTPAGGELWLQAPAISVSAITAAYGHTETYTVADYTLDGSSGRLTPNIGVGAFVRPVLVTYVAGRAVVPTLIRQAALDYIKWRWESQRGATPLPTPGGEFEVVATATVPFRILQALEPYTQGVVA